MSCISNCWTDEVARRQGSRCLVACWEGVTRAEAVEIARHAVEQHERKFVFQALLVGSVSFALGCVATGAAQAGDPVGVLMSYWG